MIKSTFAAALIAAVTASCTTAVSTPRGDSDAANNTNPIQSKYFCVASHEAAKDERRGVIYLDENERTQFLISIENGVLVDATGAPFDTYGDRPTDLWRKHKYSSAATKEEIADCEKDQADEDQKWANDKEVRHATFVMDGDGNIYASMKWKKCVFHHTSYLGGNPVSAAGEIQVKDGKIISIKNQSGHYRPAADTLLNLFEELKESFGSAHDAQLEDISWRISRFSSPSSTSRSPCD